MVRVEEELVDGERFLYLWINDQIHYDAWTFIDGILSIREDTTTYSALKNQCFSDLGDKIDGVCIKLGDNAVVLSNNIKALQLGFARDSTKFRKFISGTFNIGYIEFNTLAWNEPWSIGEFIEEWKSIAYNQLQVSGLIPLGTRISFLSYFPSLDCTIEAAVDNLKGTLRAIHAETVRSLEQKYKDNSIVIPFDFPESVRTACEQYLLYFTEFLKDVGVDAVSNINHDEAGHVIFSIRPTNAEEALEAVYQALEVYLNLPSNPNIQASFDETDTRILRLSANVQFLQSQISLKNAELHAKDTAMQALQIAVDMQRRALDGTVLLQSARPQAEGQTDEVETLRLFNDWIRIKRTEILGQQFDFPKMIRDLRLTADVGKAFRKVEKLFIVREEKPALDAVDLPDEPKALPPGEN